MKLFHEWLSRRVGGVDEESLARAVDSAFSSGNGRVVWDYLMSKYFFSVCASTDPQDLAAHNGARALLHELVTMRDLVRNPNNYNAEV